VSPVTIDELTIADDPARWAALGFDVDLDDARALIGGVWLRFTGAATAPAATAPTMPAPAVPAAALAPGAPGILAWSLRGALSDELDGLPTTRSERPVPAPARAHANGVLAIDHIVAASPQLDRSIAALQAAGLDLRRVREQPTPAGAPRQAFFRLGHEILELIQEPTIALAASADGERERAVGSEVAGGERPARFWGLALLVQDIDRAAAMLAPHASDVRAAVQPGRRIASVRRSAGLAVPLALMSRDERGAGAGERKTAGAGERETADTNEENR
jgi:hypothetical protein